MGGSRRCQKKRRGKYVALSEQKLIVYSINVRRTSHITWFYFLLLFILRHKLHHQSRLKYLPHQRLHPGTVGIRKQDRSSSIQPQ